jgi:hypothetical protein
MPAQQQGHVATALKREALKILSFTNLLKNGGKKMSTFTTF